MGAAPRTRTVSCRVELDDREEAELVRSVAVVHGPVLSVEHLSPMDFHAVVVAAMTSSASSTSTDASTAPLPGLECAVPRIC